MLIFYYTLAHRAGVPSPATAVAPPGRMAAPPEGVMARQGRVAAQRGLAAGLFLLAVAACAPTPPPSPEAGADAPNPAVGAYTGSLVADGQTFGADLRLRAVAPGRSTGVLRVSPPVELEGDVTAVIMADAMRIDVEYTTADGCEGRIVGILDLAHDGSVLEGPVTLTDCGEPVAGQILLRRTDR